MTFLVLALVGGVVHPPNNYDALTYRIPRALHWSAANQWHWISTPNVRMNLSATGFEWLMEPLLVLMRTDWLIFLPNIVAYLLLPGLVFATFRRLGVSPRVAWKWMWLVPAGYCYVMQAGSAANDAFAVVYALACVHFASRAVRSHAVQDLWLVGLSAALLTGAKASNLPLLLPCLLVALPALPLLRVRLAASAGIALIAVLVSFAPVALLNIRFTGVWTGDPRGGLQVTNPAIGLLGNGLQLASQSLLPPALPLAHQVSIALTDRIPGTVRTVLLADFPHFRFDLGELPQEESAGMGLGVTILAALAACAPLLVRGRERDRSRAPADYRLGLLVGAGAWIAALVYMCTLGSEATARLLSPYYPLLILPLLVHPANAELVRKGWWNVAAGVCAGSAIIGLVLTPSRPLFPAGFVTESLQGLAPNNAQIARIAEVYAVYAARHDLLGPLRQHVPSNVQTVGLIVGENDSEVALWQPFGSRRVVDLVTAVPTETAAGGPITWVVVKEEALRQIWPGSFEQWLEQNGGRVVDHETITAIVAAGSEDWDVVELSRERAQPLAPGIACGAPPCMG